MSYLIDTNVISEVRKGTHRDAHVFTCYASIADEAIFLSTLVLGEIRRALNVPALAIRARRRRSNAGCGKLRSRIRGVCSE